MALTSGFAGNTSKCGSIHPQPPSDTFPFDGGGWAGREPEYMG
jgi:hypothetical protein